ncbi:hypothetical protein SD81_022170 [Tolypothrix campylonemoides VB511288]|nr:hypothetical protein SD81_022170 [Tolypothrix campylonemoides VB511288]
MPEVYVLDNVIRRITESEVSKINSSTQKVVIIDPQRKKVLSRKPFLGGYVEFFLVSNSNDPGNVAISTLSFDIGDIFTDNRISLCGSYQVTCSPGKEDMVALALSEGNIPGGALERKIIAWLTEYSRTKFTFDDFANNYKEQFINLQKYAEAKVYEEVGLNLKLKLYLKQDDLKHLKSFSIKSTHFPVLVRDYEQAIDFRFETTLLISENGEVNAIIHFSELVKLEDILKQETYNFIRSNIGLYDLYFNFSESVYPQLVEHLNLILANYGRKIDYFTPKIEGILMPESFSLKHDVRCEIRDYPKAFLINNILNVKPQPENILKYKKAQISDLQTWFRAKLEQIIQKSLFDCEYITLLTNFNSVVLTVEEELKKEAEAIGYSIKLISTLPNDFKPDIKTIPIASSYFPVLVRDYEQEVNLKFSTNLLISTDGELNAIRHFKEELKLEDILKIEIRHYLRQNVSLYDLCYRFTESVRSNILQHLDNVLVNYGRKTEYFNLEIDKSILMPESFSIKHDARCEINIFSKQLIIQTTLNIRPQRENILKYRNARIANLEAWFIEKIEQIINQLLFSYDIINFIVKFPFFASLIKNELKKEAEAIGYEIELISTLPNDLKPELTPFSLKTDDFSVLVKDYEQGINYKFSTNLLVIQDEDGELDALRYLNELPKIEDIIEDILKREVRKFIHQEVSLHDLCYKLSESVDSKIVQRLDDILAKYGRKVEYFTSEIDKSILMPESFSIKHEVKCEITEYPEPVFIKNTLEVDPQLDKTDSILKYKKAQIPNLKDLQAWFKAKLDRIVQKLLFDRKYINLLLDFESEDKLAIKEELEKEAESIGYSIRLLTTVPDLKPLKLKDEGFNFTSTGTFATKYNNVKVELSIICSGKIKDLRKIEHLLNPREDVDKLIQKKVVNRVSQLLYTIEPEHFYFHFDNNPEGLSVKSELTEIITQLLTKEFHASGIDVIPIMKETDLKKSFDSLRENPLWDFEITIDSLKDLKEPVVYYGSFQIEKVDKDKWDIFQSRKHDIYTIKKFLEAHLRSRLKTLTSEKLKFKTPQQLNDTENSIKNLARAAIVEQFRLEISISNLERKYTTLEEKRRNINIEAESNGLSEASDVFGAAPNIRAIQGADFNDQLESKRSELKEVRARIKDVLTQKGNENEVSRLRQIETSLQQEITKLIQQQKAFSERASEHIKSLSAQVDDEDNLNVFLQKNSSLPSSSNPQPKSQTNNQQLQDKDEFIDVWSERVDEKSN